MCNVCIQNSIEMVVFDEADELFDNDKCIHVNDINLIISKCNHPHIQHSLFSATLDDKIMNHTQRYLNDAIQISIGGGISAAANVEQHLVYCGDERGKIIELLKIIGCGHITPPVLLFVQNDRRSMELKQQLMRYQQSHNIDVNTMADVLHNSLTSDEMNAIVNRFRNGEIWILICTDVLSRGMDFRNVSTVINYDFPQCTQQYIHRIGRSGRADKIGNAITFWSDCDRSMLDVVLTIIQQSGQQSHLPNWMLDKNKNVNHGKCKLNKSQTVFSKLNEVQRGPIRKGGSYVFGTSVLKKYEIMNRSKNERKNRRKTRLKRRFVRYRNKTRFKKKLLGL